MLAAACGNSPGGDGAATASDTVAPTTTSPATLDTEPEPSHTVWFHRPFRLDDWCLIAQHSPTLARARGFGQGHAFDAGGALVASFAQERVIRPINQG